VRRGVLELNHNSCMNEPNFEPRMPAVDVWANSNMERLFKGARRFASPGIVVVTPGHKSTIVLGLPPDDLYLAKKKRNSKYTQVLEQFASLSNPLNISAIAMTDVSVGMQDVRHLDGLPYTGAQAIPFIWDLLIIGTFGHSVLLFEGHPSVLKMGCRDADVLIVDEGMIPFLQSNWASVAHSVMRGERQILVFQREGGVRQITNASWSSSEAEDLLKRGGEKFQCEDYRGAIADLRQAIALDPTFARAYSAWGYTCTAMQDYQSAIACYEQAIRLDSCLAEAYSGRGSAYYGMGDDRQALDDFTRSIEIEPTSHRYYSRGDIYLVLQNFPQALVDFEKAMDLYLSAVYFVSLDSDLAARLNRIQSLYRAGITYRHSPVEPRIQQAFDALDTQKYQEALDHLSRAIQIEPELADLYYHRGTAYFYLGQEHEALDNLSRAIQLNPRFADFYNDRGEMYLSQGNKACMADFSQAIKLDPYRANPYYKLGICYSNLGNKQDALYYLNQAVTLFQKEGDRLRYEEVIGAISRVNNSQ
jgi:tetratricopeptide (TPR) repeat protein